MSKINIYIFILADFSISVFDIKFVIINFTLCEHSIYLDLCVCMCVCVVWLAFFSMKEKMAINETRTAIYYSQCLFSAHIIWVHRFIIIDYNSYHL